MDPLAKLTGSRRLFSRAAPGQLQRQQQYHYGDEDGQDEAGLVRGKRTEMQDGRGVRSQPGADHPALPTSYGAGPAQQDTGLFWQTEYVEQGVASQKDLQSQYGSYRPDLDLSTSARASIYQNQLRTARYGRSSEHFQYVTHPQHEYATKVLQFMRQHFPHVADMMTVQEAPQLAHDLPHLFIVAETRWLQGMEAGNYLDALCKSTPALEAAKATRAFSDGQQPTVNMVQMQAAVHHGKSAEYMKIVRQMQQEGFAIPVGDPEHLRRAALLPATAAPPPPDVFNQLPDFVCPLAVTAQALQQRDAAIAQVQGQAQQAQAEGDAKFQGQQFGHVDVTRLPGYLAPVQVEQHRGDGQLVGNIAGFYQKIDETRGAAVPGHVDVNMLPSALKPEQVRQKAANPGELNQILFRYGFPAGALQGSLS